MEKIFNFIRSKNFIIIIVIVLGFAVLAGAFALGAIVGYRKAGFSYAWGENYHRNFGGPKDGFLRDLVGFGAGDFIEGHGAFGQIIKIDSSASSGQVPSIVVKGRDNVEKIVLIKDDTIIRHPQGTIQLSELKVDDFIVVIGEPNDAGQIEAKFIRFMPSPSANQGSPSPMMRWR